MGVVSRLILSANLQKQILSHARTALPEEAVGLLGGSHDGRVMLSIPLLNLAVDEGSFLADPYEQFCALKRFEAEKLQLLAIYHSHPAGGAEPSDEDLQYAKRWSCAHLIIALGTQGRSYERIRAFRCIKTSSVGHLEVPIFLSQSEHHQDAGVNPENASKL